MSILDTLLSGVAPHVCVSCKKEGAVMCKACALSAPTLPSICYVCARATKNHAPCALHTLRYSPISIYIAGEYAGVIKELIKAYKFDYKRAAAKDASFYLYNTLPYIGNDVVVSYVPATGAHIRQRGFHHTRRIAKEVSRLLSLDCIDTLFRETTVTQKGADRNTRKQQLSGAFRALPATANGKNILLIDDVITTGATIEACAKVLYRAGANEVRVAVVARTPN
jgi:ComF family protein